LPIYPWVTVLTQTPKNTQNISKINEKSSKNIENNAKKYIFPQQTCPRVGTMSGHKLHVTPVIHERLSPEIEFFVTFPVVLCMEV